MKFNRPRRAGATLDPMLPTAYDLHKVPPKVGRIFRREVRPTPSPDPRRPEGCDKDIS